MPDLELVIGLFVADPILGYSLLAAVFLALVSLTAGIARLDLLALAQPRAALACVLCVAAAVLLRLLLYGDAGTDPDTLRPALAGIERFPLILAALAYGPTPGMLVAGLYATFDLQGEVPAARALVLALELALVGWLAIYPSPRQHRWAGPVNAIAGYFLAWSTGGLALTQWQFGDLATDNLLTRHASDWLGVLATALALYLIGPSSYRRLLPRTRIYEDGSEEQVVIGPLGESRRERRRRLSSPDAPTALGKRNRRRRSG